MANAGRQITVKPWVPSPMQQQAAEYLAAGYSQYRTAQLLERPHKQIWEWTQKPAFAVYVAELREQLVAAQRPLYEHSISLAQQIVLRALTGEDVDDDLYRRAEALLQRTLWRTATPRAAIAAKRELGEPEPGGPSQLR